ncbi:MAG: immune inhibitor A [Anaerolineae bacterium]|nr:immune inhibitor A [Anaerolineae bacterium]
MMNNRSQHTRFTLLLLRGLIIITILFPAATSAPDAHAQDAKQDPTLSWADAPITPRHRSQADWLYDTNQKTFEEAYGPFTTRTYEVGDAEQFIPLGSMEGTPETFFMAYRTEHAYFWFERGIRPDLDTVQRVGDFFETHIWPLNTSIYGEARNPGIDGDSRIHVVNESFISIGLFGAFDPEDQCPRSVCPDSNQREIIYINLDTAPLGSDAYQATLTHEHQHLIQFNIDGNERRWLNEGLSQLAEHLNGFEPMVIADSNVRDFLSQPDHFLGGWTSDYDMGRYYGASYLFAVYLYERMGLDFIRHVSRSDLDGLASIQAELTAANTDLTLDDLFADWIVANTLDDPYVADGHYYYQTLDLPMPILPHPLIVSVQGFTHDDSINQYGADYISINQPGIFNLSFDGMDETPLINTPPKSGDWMWWSYNAINSAARITGAFDLRDLSTATLAFSAWWEMEEDYDWFQVLVSNDNGATWEVVGGSEAQPRNLQAPGVYYSGQSDAWIDETIDLSAYAGAEVLVRFEYLTDSSTTLPGIALDDIGIVELGALDSAEDAVSIWQMEGFMRVPYTVPQNWTVTALVHYPDDTTTAHPMKLDALHTGRIQITIPPDGRATIVIGAMAPFTTNRTTYKLSVTMEL